ATRGAPGGGAGERRPPGPAPRPRPPPAPGPPPSGGAAATILEYLNAGLVDEFSITLSPVLFGAGTRLFDGVDASRIALEPVRSEPSPRVTHLTYSVRPR
ncbi:dihydrofolate reductase family protein, partial [Streptomyces sp. NPDC058464]|uniref:dihydrofolate reductase family protein n=1 Tax=Streptomyces sp. NPDC058464 TaxID=3346511 RepID=UPI0036477C30